MCGRILGVFAIGVLLGLPASGQAVHGNTDWFQQARWGVMTHYLGAPPSSAGGAELTAEAWNQQVDAFDVSGLADQVASTGAKYLLLTIGQNSGHFCSPNATYDKLVGILPSKCSRRDLVADLAKVLKAKGIRLLVYLPSGAPAADPVARKKLGWRWGSPGAWQLPGEPVGGRLVEFQRKWEAIIREWSLRWGKDVSGWWIDGCYFADQMYRFDDEPNFASFAAALKAGNPESIVAFNPGVRIPVTAHTKHEDYAAGEVDLPQLARAVAECRGRWLECEGAKVQFHILTFLGASWCSGDRPQWPNDKIIALTRRIVDQGGVVTYDVPIQRNGLIPGPFVEQLRAIGRAVPAARAGAGDKTSLVPPVLLPDGQEFKTWEMPRAFSKTYYVNQAHPNAADDNPGSQDRPWRTIGRAAQALQPGERVVVAAGVYRERVRPARGGNNPETMISYEAAPGADVVLSGSRLVASKWSLSSRSTPNSSQPVWMTTLPQEFFTGENPFKEVNLTDDQIDRSMDWAVPTKGKAPNTLRRGLVFQDGNRLRQVVCFEELSRGEGSYWVEDDGRTIHVRPLGGIDPVKPAQAKFEATTQGFIFAPDAFGLGYIRVKGLTIEHSGNCFPRPQQGALSAMRGHHWIIEECTVRQCNSIGIDVGDQFDTAGPGLAQGGQHIVRQNTITDCGIGGLEGINIHHTLIEDNVIRRCGWQDAWRIYECGGIKVHCTRSCVLRRNLVTDTTSAPGIWMDYANANSRCTCNVILRAQCEAGGIFMEASQSPNLVDTNVVWATRGNGIYQHDCDELTIAHNLVAGSTDAAVRMQVCQGRIVGGRPSTAKRNRIVNNIFVNHARPLAISDPENQSDYNVFDTSRGFDLAAWQKVHKWDAHSAAIKLAAQLDSKTLTLTCSADGRLPTCPVEPRVDFDFFAKPRAGLGTPPGPFATFPTGPVSLRTSPLP